MTANYTFSIQNDFGGQVDTSFFHQQLSTNIMLQPKFAYIETNDDALDAWFNSTLTTPERNELQNVVDTYTNPVTGTIYKTQVLLMLASNSTASDIYTKLSSFIYDPESSGTVNKVLVSAYKDISALYYSVRLQNTTESNTVAEGSFNNIVEQIKTLTVQNSPTQLSTIEVQIKRVGIPLGSLLKSYVNSVNIYSV